MLGGMIGGLGSAWLTDLATKIMVRINRGIYEPEFRILTQAIAVVAMALGYFVFVWLFEHPFSTGYYLGAFLHGCICLGITVSTVSSSLYILCVSLSHFNCSRPRLEHNTDKSSGIRILLRQRKSSAYR